MKKVVTLMLAFALCQALNRDIHEIIDELRVKVSEAQAKKDAHFIPGVHWAKQKGSYPSYVMLNFVGGPEQELLRNYGKFYDNNAFITLWVTTLQLEAALLPGGPHPGEEQLLLALNAIKSYHDRNKGNDSSTLVFWPQKFNETSRLWVCDADNIGAIAVDEEAFSKVFTWLLAELGLKNDSEHMKEFTRLIQAVVNEFHIPADADDTFVNIGLGSLLQKYTHHEDAYMEWLQANPHVSNAINKLLQYSYEPFGEAVNNSIIDPRTYFYLRNFFYENEKFHNTDIKLPITWMTSFYENVLLVEKGIRMPFNLNNVDLTVSANVLYGLTSAVLFNMDDPEDWFNTEMQILYKSIADMIIYELKSNLSSRPDLALTYYPSKFVFYWFTSRTLQLLRAADGQLMYSVMKEASLNLESLLRYEFTDALVKSAVHDESGLLYYDDFLGNADKDLFGKPVNRAEDRIFSTSMAANTLLYIWREGTDLSPNTPTMVSTTIQQLCSWLLQHSLTGKYKPHNAFFSGSVKSEYLEMTFYYPTNYQRWLNGTLLPENYTVTMSSSMHSAVGMLGMMEEDEYNLQLKEKHFGKLTPIDFPGYNGLDGIFAFWSSDELTYSSVILALTHCQYLFT